MLWTLLACADPPEAEDTSDAEEVSCPPTCEEGELLSQGECRAVDPLYGAGELELLGERLDSPFANGRYEVYTDADALAASWDALFTGDEEAGEPPELDFGAQSAVLVVPGLVDADQDFELAALSIYSQTVNAYGLLQTAGDDCDVGVRSSTPAWIYATPAPATTGSLYIDRWTCDC